MRSAIDARGKAFVKQLEANPSPLGGWAYYDDPPYTRRPTWATSFCTALVLPSLADAKARGFDVPDKALAKAKALRLSP